MHFWCVLNSLFTLVDSWSRQLACIWLSNCSMPVYNELILRRGHLWNWHWWTCVGSKFPIQVHAWFTQFCWFTPKIVVHVINLSRKWGFQQSNVISNLTVQNNKLDPTDRSYRFVFDLFNGFSFNSVNSGPENYESFVPHKCNSDNQV